MEIIKEKLKDMKNKMSSDMYFLHIVLENEDRGHTGRENDLIFQNQLQTFIHNSKKHNHIQMKPKKQIRTWDRQHWSCRSPKQRPC